MSAPKEVEITDSASRSHVHINYKKRREGKERKGKNKKVKDYPFMETSSKQIPILNGLDLMNVFNLKEPQ